MSIYGAAQACDLPLMRAFRYTSHIARVNACDCETRANSNGVRRSFV